MREAGPLEEQARARIIPVVLAGGSGTRLWPLSREQSPKQFQSFGGRRTLLQDALLRCIDPELFVEPIIVSNADHAAAIAEQAAALDLAAPYQILEPVARSTAPAAAAAAIVALKKDPNAILLVAPADHLIDDPDAFRTAVRTALPVADRGLLVTFGIAASAPHTGYGYIEAGEAVEGIEGVSVVREFIEKPPLPVAEQLLRSGRHSWNSGIFLMGARAFLAELARHDPATASACGDAVGRGLSSGSILRLDPASFGRARAASIDVAVMERTDRAAVVPVDMRWSDLGSWSSVWEASARDPEGNVAIGDVLMRGARNCYVRSDGPLTVVSGVGDVVVVATPDAILVTSRDQAEEVKQVVAALRTARRGEAVSHARVERPWGYYETVHAGERFQVKRITVKPGGKLSLQKHHHRAEHWTVVNGTALVTCGDTVRLLREDESAYIPLGTIHRLENPGKVPLNLIEVQSGAYLGEDDIVRVDDAYGRETARHGAGSTADEEPARRRIRRAAARVSNPAQRSAKHRRPPEAFE